MGKIKQGILGGFSGKVGGVVGSSWKGIAVMKAMPLSVANPRTAPQVAQRTLFGNVAQFAVMILAAVIKPLWDRFAIRMSGYNEFIQTNIDLFSGEMPGVPADLIIGKGKMASTPFNAIEFVVDQNELNISYTNDSGSGYKLSTDKCYCVCVNISQKEVGVSAANYERSEEMDMITMPHTFNTSDVVWLYMCFKRADGTVVSETYAAQVTEHTP